MTGSPRRRWKIASARATSDASRRTLSGAATNGHLVRTRVSELLRFATAGSVDDGKSTLIGRLLYDSKAIFEDQLEHVAETSERRGDGVPEPRAADRRPARRARAGDHDRRRLSLLRDPAPQVHHRRHAGPRAVHAQHGHRRLDRRPVDRARRRAQGRHRADAAPRASSPRCCASRTWSSASTRWTSSTTTRRCSTRILDELTDWAARLEIPDITFIPISALHGDNVVDALGKMPWYDGPPLLYHLEHVVIAPDRNLIDVRFPVQWVIRPDERRAPRLSRLRRPGRGRRAAARATRSSCCRAASARTVEGDRHVRAARSTRRSRRCP